MKKVEVEVVDHGGWKFYPLNQSLRVGHYATEDCWELEIGGERATVYPDRKTRNITASYGGTTSLSDATGATLDDWKLEAAALLLRVLSDKKARIDRAVDLLTSKYV